MCITLSRNGQYQQVCVPSQIYVGYILYWLRLFCNSLSLYCFQFNFVNGVVIDGGVQFDTMTRHVEEYLKSSIKRKMKNVQNIEIETGDVKSHLWVFINADYPFFMVNHICKVCDCVCVCFF